MGFLVNGNVEQRFKMDKIELALIPDETTHSEKMEQTEQKFKA